MSGSVYATIPIQQKESSQIPTIAKLTGELTGMLEERTFCVVWVPANHGVEVASTGRPDVVVQYKGGAVKIFRSRKTFSIFSSMFIGLCRSSGRFLPSSLHPKIERLIKPYLRKAFYTEHWQLSQYPIMDI